MNKDENSTRAENSSVCKYKGVEYKSELKYTKENPSAATQINRDVKIARLEVTMILYFTGDDTATYLSTVSAMSVRIDAVHKIKYKMCKILISTMSS